jgi:hypothetical protein
MVSDLPIPTSVHLLPGNARNPDRTVRNSLCLADCTISDILKFNPKFEFNSGFTKWASYAISGATTLEG